MGRKKKEEPKLNKKDLLKKTLAEINRQFGKNTIQLGKNIIKWEKLSTGIIDIDDLLGGGVPYGHTSVIWGGEGSGKTTICYYLIAQAQKDDKTVYYIDLENSFEPERAKQFGIDLDKLLIGKFPIAEKALQTIIDLTKNKVVDVIILDSIHSLSPKGEQQEKSGKGKSIENDTMALLARKLSQFFRMVSAFVYKANTALIMIGQTRTSIGFIAIEQLTGGHALRHNSVLTLHIRRGQKADAPTEKSKDSEGKTKRRIVGFDCKIKIDKTQTPETADELTEIHLPFYFESGFSKPKDKK